MIENIYLAGGLFSAGERLHNLFFEKHLRNLGHNVILPQRDALNFFENGLFDIPSIREDCFKNCSNPTHICVTNSDGPDADAGTAVEYGFALHKTGRAIVYRTDFRTSLENEVGLTAMLVPKEGLLVYNPCYFTELDEVDEYYCNLALKIDEAIKTLTNEGPHDRVRFNFPKQDQQGETVYFFLEHNLNKDNTQNVLIFLNSWHGVVVDKIGYQTKITVPLLHLDSYLKYCKKNGLREIKENYFSISNHPGNIEIDKKIAKYWENNLHDS